MSKYANPGELRTPVYFKRIERKKDAESYPHDEEVNVFGEGIHVLTKWVNAHGTEAFTALQLALHEPATITCRYSPLITETCLVYRKGDDEPFEILSIDNVEQRNLWLEIKVQRRVPAR